MTHWQKRDFTSTAATLETSGTQLFAGAGDVGRGKEARIASSAASVFYKFKGSFRLFFVPVIMSLPSPLSSQTTDLSRKKPPKATSLLHRTPWRPPVGVSAKGIYIDLDDGRRLIDAVGGAAVACIGYSHPAVMQSIKDQIDKVSCRAS